MSFIHILVRTVEDILRIIFVQRVVGEMNIAAIQVFICRFMILFCGESCQSFVVDIQSKRVSSCHEHIDSQIKFELINEHRVLDVPLNHIFVSV